MTRRRRKRVGRPRLKNREAVRSELVTLKLSPAERDLLDELVRLRADELRAHASGATVAVTASSYLRGLILRDAEEKTLVGRAEPGTVLAKRRRRR